VPRAVELTDRPRIAVVAGILRDAGGRVLIARRGPGQHGAGFWEFPGGKRAAGETAAAALGRELAEELGISVEAAEPFLALEHDYPDRRVALEFFLVTRFDGEPVAREGQPLRWVPLPELAAAGLLPADEPVVAALVAHGRAAGGR
jgi:8-oxo-dGTP diphosphatase